MVLKYNVNTDNLTINYILKNELKISSRLFTKLIKNSLVTLNKNPCDTRSLTHIGDTISNIVPTKMDLDIIYEDDSFIILNKPKNTAVHPSHQHFENSLSNGLKYYFDSINLHKKIRPVNRLDLNTSGLILFAKNEYVQECLIRQMATNTFKKEYLAVVTGKLDVSSGTINKPIARKPGSIIERCISENGKPSVTHFEVLKKFDDYSLVKCSLETGRTHQIRVHFASIGHPLLGDDLYGIASDLIDGQALTCYSLSFKHPVTGKDFSIQLKNVRFF